jgi:hypothetical protein
MSISNEQVSLRALILGADDLPLTEVYVPEWQLSVWVATMTTRERGAFEARHVVERVKNVRERFVVATVCDSQRNLLFTDDDIEALSGKNSKACDRIFEVALKVNAMRDEEISELKKTSETTLFEGSSSS